MPPKGDKSPLKRTHKEIKETPSEHEKSASSSLDTARDGIKKAKIEQNQLRPEAALQVAFAQVAGKVQGDLRKKTEAEPSQKGNIDKYREQADFAKSRMIDNTNRVKNLFDHNPDLQKQSRDNNHDRIKQVSRKCR